MSDPKRSDAANALVEAARRRSADAARKTDAANASAVAANASATSPTAAPSASPSRGWRAAVVYIARWAAIGLGLALAWHAVRPPYTVQAFALRLLTAAAALTILTLLRDPSSLAIVELPRILPGADSARAQRAAFMAEVERAQREPPLTVYRFIAVLVLVGIALIILALT